MQKLIYSIGIFGLLISLSTFFINVEKTDYIFGCGLGIFLVFFMIELARYLAKKKVHFKSASQGEELYHEEVVSFKREKEMAWGKIFITNKGLKFESPNSFFSKKIEWEGTFNDIESIKKSKLFGLKFNFLTQGIIEISSDNREQLKERILRRVG